MRGPILTILLLLTPPLMAAQIGGTSGTPITIQALPADKLENLTYNPNEYWLKGSNIVNNFSIQDASKFYTNLLETVELNFIKTIPYSELVAKILYGLSGFSGKIDITVANNRILVYNDKLKLIGNFNKPFDNDATAWANLIVNIILSLRENNKEISQAHPEQIYQVTATYLLKTLDANATYYDPISVEKKINNYNSTSLGFTYRRTPNGIQVLSILRNSPLYFSNIEEGDLITHINTKPTTQIPDEILESIITNNTNDITHLNYISYITQTANDSYVRKVEITPSSSKLDLTNPTTPVLNIYNFKQNSAQQLNADLDNININDINGLIIDLRTNNGGEITEAIESANLFINGGDILKTKGLGTTANQLYTAKAGDKLNNKPIIIIADHSTKGIAEIFTAILEEKNRALIVGSPTFGDAMIRTSYPLSNGSQISFATKQAVLMNDAPIDKIGIIPLICTASFIDPKSIDKFTNDVKINKFQDNRDISKTPTTEEINILRKGCPAFYPTNETLRLPIQIATKILNTPEIYKKLMELNKN